MSTIGDKESNKKIKHYALYFFAGLIVLILGLVLCLVNRIFGFIVVGIGFLIIAVSSSIMNYYSEKQDKLDQQAELKQNMYHISAEKRETKKFDVKRYPIKLGDKAAWEELVSVTQKFLDNFVAPEGFYEFLDKFDYANTQKRFVMDKFNPVSMLGANYFELFDLVKSENIKDYNLDFITRRDDYHTMFRNVLFFGDDSSGHCHFFLDYSKGLEYPSVKFLDDESDTVQLVAVSFDEMQKNLVDEDYINQIESIEMNSTEFAEWFKKGVRSLKSAKNYIVNIYEDEDSYTCDLVSSDSRNFEDDIDEKDVYSRGEPYLISKKNPLFDYDSILMHMKNLIKYVVVFEASLEKFCSNHNILYGFVDGDLFAFNKFTAIKNIQDSQVYEFKTDNTKYENISKRELIEYFDKKFKENGFNAFENKWIKDVNGKFYVFEIQDSIYDKNVFYFNIGLSEDLKNAKGDHKDWKTRQRLLFGKNSEETFESIMQWFKSNDK